MSLVEWAGSFLSPVMCKNALSRSLTSLLVGCAASCSIAMSAACGAAPQSTPAQPAPAPAPAASTAASAPYPVVHIEAANRDADERDTVDYDLRADGSFAIEHVMSNGGGDSTVTECTGRLPTADAATWFARMQREATLATAPRGLSYGEAQQRQVHVAYGVSYAAEPGRMVYADPEPWTSELAALLARMQHLGVCAKATTR